MAASHDFSDWPRVQGCPAGEARELLAIANSITTSVDFREWSGTSVLMFPEELCAAQEPRMVLATWTVVPDGGVMFNIFQRKGDEAFWGRIAQAGGLRTVWPEFDQALQTAQRSSNPRRALERLRRDPWRFAREVA